MGALIVVTGPIASGKSAVASGLADRVAAAGRSAAVVDVDDVVTMVRAPAERFDRSWAQAREAHGELVAAWLRAGVDVVVAHGPIYTPDEEAALCRPLPPGTPARRVLLLATYEAALARVADDPSRSLSRDPAFLQTTYDRFARLRPAMTPCDVTFDTTTTPLAAIVTRLEALTSRGGGGP